MNGVNVTKNGLIVLKDNQGRPYQLLPITSSKNVYLDDNGTQLHDVINDNPVLSGTSQDELIIFNFNTTARKIHYFRFMAVLKEPNEVYVADFIIKGENGMMESKLNEFTESSGRPSVKIYNNSLIVDLTNVETFNLYTAYYGTIYDKYVLGVNNMVGKYAYINSNYPNLLPSHTSISDLRTKLESLESLFSSIGGRLTFMTVEEVDDMFDRILGYTPAGK